MTFPLGLERRDIADNPTTCVCGLTETDNKDVSWDAEVLDGTSQSERVRWDDARITRHVNKALVVEFLGINHCTVDVSEDLELRRTAHIVSVAGCTVADDFLTVR
jgi:hypothetical protein